MTFILFTCLTAYPVTEGHPRVKRIAILATTGTITQGALAASLLQNGLHVVIPCDADQRLLHETIYNTQWGLKAISRVTDQAQTNVTLILARVASLGIDAFLLACTELSFAVDANMYEDIPIFDSLKAWREK